MALLPVDRDVLADVCLDVALEHYGFLYVAEQKDTIIDEYAAADTRMLRAGSISPSDLRDALPALTERSFRRLRDGVYYVDTFSIGGESEQVTEALTRLFSQRIVVTGEKIREEFGLALDDIDFFIDKLAERTLVERIAAGGQDYYIIGEKLKEHAEDVGLATQLEFRATHGVVTHSDLEDVIDVSATRDVIQYLQREGYVVDLDGEYLVSDIVDEYAASLAREIDDAAEAELAESKHVLTAAEFDAVVEHQLRERFEVLSVAPEYAEEIIEETAGALVEDLSLDRNRMVVDTDRFEEFVDGKARDILRRVETERDRPPAKRSGYMEEAEPMIEEVSVSPDESVNEYVRESISERCVEVIDTEKIPT